MKGLIKEMISRLEDKAFSGATSRPIVAKCFLRAIVIIRKVMKEGASMMQLSVIDALNVMVHALSINSVDATKLAALVQNSQTSEDVDDIVTAGAPIVETSED